MTFDRFIPLGRSALIAAVAVVLAVGCAREQATDAGNADATSTAASTTTPAAPPPAAAAKRDVCTMLSAEEVKTATGIEGKATPSTSGGADVCTWMSNAGKSAIVQLYPYASSYENSREAFEGLYKTKSEELSGLGDKAFFVGGKTGPFESATISAMKGSNAISVQVLGMGDAATLKNEATALTQVVLGKM
jgi:hypothetical protein